MIEKDKTGKKMERRVAKAYRRMHAWKVEHDVKIDGSQIDVYVEQHTRDRGVHRVAIEAKDWSKSVGIEVARKFVRLVDDLRQGGSIDEGIIVSAVGFTKQARECARNHAIRLLEMGDLDAMVQQAEKSAPPKPQELAIPAPPEPYFAHPYLMPKNWTGRTTEMAKLDTWLADKTTPLCCLVAHGGTGKSSLAWNWLKEGVEPKQQKLAFDGVFQWSFYEGEVSFQRFLDDLSAYLGVPDQGDPVSSIVRRLNEHRFVLVLDGFERLLREYASPDPDLQEDRAAE